MVRPEPSVSTTTTTPSLEVGDEELSANSSGAAGVAPSSKATRAQAPRSSPSAGRGGLIVWPGSNSSSRGSSSSRGQDL